MRIRSPRTWGSAAPLPDAYGTLAEEYLTATRKPGILKRSFKSDEFNNSAAIRKLTAEPPLHFDARPRVALPTERTRIDMSLEDAIRRRVSNRSFGQTPLSAADFASVLYLGNGVRTVAQPHTESAHYYRNVPNAGNLGSIEIFPIVMNVAGVEPGIYHYDTIRHDLACLKPGQFRGWLRERALLQAEAGDAAVCLVLTCALGRLRTKYQDFALQLGFMDAGHVSENISLASTALGLPSFATTGFVTVEITRSLDLDGLDRLPVLMLCLGTAPEE